VSYLSTRMLATILALQLAAAGSLQDTGRVPIPTPERAARALPLEDLLAKIPDDAWGPWPNRWTLSPEALELRRRAEGGELPDEDWRTALVAADTIHTRKRWPAGEPLVLWVDEQAWLRSTDIRVHAVRPELGEVSANNLTHSWCGNCYESEKMRNRNLRLAELPEGTTQVLFEVTILQREDPEQRGYRREPPRQLWKGRLELPIEAVSTAEAALPSTKDGVEAVRKAFRADRSNAKNYDGEPVFFLRGTYEEYPALRDVGIALRVELWHGDRSMGSTDVVADKSSKFSVQRGNGFAGFGMIEGLADALRAPDVDLSSWTIRVRGTSSRALALWEADRWWSGEFTVSFADAISPDDR
jgi:hypothetical protein